jgi:hypothetical protein
MKRILIICLLLVGCGEVESQGWTFEGHYQAVIEMYRADPVYNGVVMIGDSNAALCSERVPDLFSSVYMRSFGGLTSGYAVRLVNDVILEESPTEAYIMLGSVDCFRSNLYDYNNNMRELVLSLDLPVTLIRPLPNNYYACDANVLAYMGDILASIASDYDNVAYIDRYDDFLVDGQLDYPVYDPDLLHINADGCDRLFGPMF